MFHQGLGFRPVVIIMIMIVVVAGLLLDSASSSKRTESDPFNEDDWEVFEDPIAQRHLRQAPTTTTTTVPSTTTTIASLAAASSSSTTEDSSSSSTEDSSSSSTEDSSSTTESSSTTTTTESSSNTSTTTGSPEEPKDICGTNFVANGGMDDPAPCVAPTTNCSKYCMKDFSDDSRYSCQWSARSDNSENATVVPVEIPGNCDANNVPPAIANLTSPTFACQLNSNVTGTPTKCICTEWDGTCPEEELKSCERDQLKELADRMVEQTMEISERVNPGCPCNYSLEQKLPMVIEALNQRRNLYRVVMFLFEARTQHICNRRRLMTCNENGKCDCADGTERRQLITSEYRILSYYCYANTGDCDADPAETIPQFNITKSRVWEHYGDPTQPSHKNDNGCFYNYCTKPENLNGRRTCEGASINA